MPYQELTGNLFASKAQALVNTVNCVGPIDFGTDEILPKLLRLRVSDQESGAAPQENPSQT